MAYYLDIDVSTLYNWRKYKPNLYRIVMLGFTFDELLDVQQEYTQRLQSYRDHIQNEVDTHRVGKEKRKIKE